MIVWVQSSSESGQRHDMGCRMMKARSQNRQEHSAAAPDDIDIVMG